jgi:hypothetical protein
VVTKIVVGQFPTLQGIGQPSAEATHLFLWRDVQEDFHQPGVVLLASSVVVEFRR